MLPVHVATVRLFLHVLGATVWVGGQVALAGVGLAAALGATFVGVVLRTGCAPPT